MRKRRQRCPVNVAWLRLQNGTLRVDLDTCEVFSWIEKQDRWLKVKFTETVASSHRGIKHHGGYLYAKLRIVIDDVRYRQSCFLHRIVWMARHNQELKPEQQIDHGPAGKKVNHHSNLERVTPAENAQRRSQANRKLAAAACDDDF